LILECNEPQWCIEFDINGIRETELGIEYIRKQRKDAAPVFKRGGILLPQSRIGVTEGNTFCAIRWGAIPPRLGRFEVDAKV